jgi:hypothetical protein
MLIVWAKRLYSDQSPLAVSVLTVAFKCIRGARVHGRYRIAVQIGSHLVEADIAINSQCYAAQEQHKTDQTNCQQASY